MKTILVVIYILVFLIFALCLYAVTQIKLLGIKRQTRKIRKAIRKHVTTRTSNIPSRSGKNLHSI